MRRRFKSAITKDCKMLAVKLPNEVVQKLDTLSGGIGAREYLTRYALTITRMKNAQINRSKF